MGSKFNAAAYSCIPPPIIFPTHVHWQGRIQFFIDALDKAAARSRPLETEVIINHFPIDLELELGAAFTERITYTGIYTVSDLGFDMSFKVQCSETYSGPNCATCLTGRDMSTNCTTCLPGYDPHTNCAQCLTGRDKSTNCTMCLPGYDPSINCTQCLTG